MEPTTRDAPPQPLVWRVTARPRDAVTTVVRLAARGTAGVLTFSGRWALAGWVEEAPGPPEAHATSTERSGGARLANGLSTAALAAIVAVTPAAAQGPAAPRPADAEVVSRVEAPDQVRAPDADLASVSERGTTGPGRVSAPDVAAAPRPLGDRVFDAQGSVRKPIYAVGGAPQVRQSVIEYRVRRGDTVSSIARRFGVTWMTIWWANRLEEMGTLRIGQKLRIMPDVGIRHEVRDGDTLDSIAREYSADPAGIAESNMLTGGVVVIGQRLFIPDGRGAPYQRSPEISAQTPVPRLAPGQAGQAADEGPGLAAPLATLPAATTTGGVKGTDAFAWPIHPDTAATVGPVIVTTGQVTYGDESMGTTLMPIGHVEFAGPPEDPSPPGAVTASDDYREFAAEIFADTFVEAFSHPVIHSPLDGSFFLRDVADGRLERVRQIVLRGLTDRGSHDFRVIGSPAQKALFSDALRRITYPLGAIRDRIAVRFGATPPRTDGGPSWGFADFGDRTISLDPSLTRDQMIYSILHEIAHFVDVDLLTRQQRVELMALMTPRPATWIETGTTRIPVAKPPDGAGLGDQREWPPGGPPAGPPRGRVLSVDDPRLKLTPSRARLERSLAWPVADGGTITQGFHGSHVGLDIAAPWGTPVLAAHRGIIIYRGWRDDRGANTIWIKHGPNLYTSYIHLAGFAVRRGEWVERGQVIAAVGSTGYSTGPHLHFGVSVDIRADMDLYQRSPLRYLDR